MCQLIFYPKEHDTSPPRPEALNDLADTDVLIPYTRLTRPQEDLSQELRDRPLLMLYRYVRFHTCYVADDDEPRRFIEAQLGGYVLGQVVDYRSTERLSFGTAAGVPLRPASGYICFVTIRHQASDEGTTVMLSCEAAWHLKVDRDEFIVGWCHGVPVNTRPNQCSRRFRSRWTELTVHDVPYADLQRVLKDTFIPSGSDTTVDFGTEPIAVASEFGRAITIRPLHYVRSYIGPDRLDIRMNDDIESDEESPAEVLAVGMSRGRPLPRTFSIVRANVFQQFQENLPFSQQHGAVEAAPPTDRAAAISPQQSRRFRRILWGLHELPGQRSSSRHRILF
ncbi:hypothetical protein V7S43_010778 [Phytophthora oleae]|uniref:Uncharacterized protein n=1 Tax=Phytophthora oleae TaxID=2107226 RepID=A0ABD3FC01_9STRA